jgi:hypothetical protein
MKFKSDIEVQAGLRDGGNDIGTAGQILSSTGSQTNWIDQDSIVASEAKLVVVECKNTSGSTISKGTPVYQTGTVGATDVIEIDAADASDEDKMAAIGLLQSDLANNAFGKVVITGELLNITTSPIDGVTPVTGDTIYVKSGGGLTLTKPTGVNFIQNIGLVGKVSGGNSGSITVSSIMRSNDVPTPLYIDHDNQRLGIGIETPDSTLHVSGPSTLASQGTVLKIENTADQGSSQDIYIYNQYDRDIGIKFETLGGTNYIWQDSNSDDALILSSGGNNRANDSTLILEQDHDVLIPNGKVGIGVSPAVPLHVDGFARLNGGLQMNATNAQIYQILDSDLRFGTNNTERMRIDNAGNVGIGTTSPASPLHLSMTNGDVRIQGETSRNHILSRTSDDTTWRDLAISATSGQKQLVLATGGNVGIGTTSPIAKLDVNGVIRSRGGSYAADVDTKTDVGLVIPENYFIYTADGSSYLRKLIGKTSDIITIGEAGTSLIDGINLVPGTAGGYVQIFNNSSIAAKFVDGKLGIGTTSPSEKLDIVGNIELNGALYIGSRGIYQQENTDVSGLELVANASTSLYRAAFFDYVIQKTGNVRAGTVFACNDGGSVEYTETSTNDIGDTSDVVLSVDISGGNMRLLADAATSGWSVKSLIRAI